MSILFGILVDSRTVAAERAYGTITTGRGRAEALRQAGDVYFEIRKAQTQSRDRETIKKIEETRRIFERVIHNYGAAATRRNDVAHGIAWNLSLSLEETGNWFLVAPLYQSGRTKSWVEDDVRMREKLGRSIKDPASFGDFQKIYRKNAEYVYGITDIKVITGKFEHFEHQIIKVINFLSPGKLPDVLPLQTYPSER